MYDSFCPELNVFAFSSEVLCSYAKIGLGLL
jgi:hypothetical protein